MSKVSKAQAGITLVELMIGMTIGLVVTGAVFTVVLSNQQTVLSKNALDQTQESLRFSTITMNRLIRQAKSFTKPNAEGELIINFDSKQRDCIGKVGNSEQNIFRFIDGKLICELKELDSSEIKQYVLASNVHALSFKYGFVENDVVNYVAFNDAALNGKWNLVTTIQTKISLTLNGSQSNHVIEFVATSHNKSLQVAERTETTEPPKNEPPETIEPPKNEPPVEDPPDKNNNSSEGANLTLNEIMEILKVKISKNQTALIQTWSHYHKQDTTHTVSIKNNETITINFSNANEDALSKWTINGKQITNGLSFDGPQGNVNSIQLTLTDGKETSVLTFKK